MLIDDIDTWVKANMPSGCENVISSVHIFPAAFKDGPKVASGTVTWTFVGQEQHDLRLYGSMDFGVRLDIYGELIEAYWHCPRRRMKLRWV